MCHQVESILPVQTQLGECPLWSVREQALYFIDILAPAIHRYEPASGLHRVMPVDQLVGCIGLRPGGGFVAAMRSGIFYLNAQGHTERQVAGTPQQVKHRRFNDGRVDAFGRFWSGSIWEPRDRNGGVLYRLDNQLNFTEQASDVLVSNGLAFSPDNRWVYHADTAHRVLYRYPMDPLTGDIGQRQILTRFPAGEGGSPDGAAVDSEGFYWCAMVDGGRIVRIDPDKGDIVQEIAVPVRGPTMVAFGGLDLKTLYITSLRAFRTEQELAQFPLSGNLFSVHMDVAGLPEPEFIECPLPLFDRLC